MPRQRRPRAEWEKHVLSWKASGLTQQTYCEQHELNPKTFSYWLRKTRPKQVIGSGKSILPLIPINIVESENSVTPPTPLSERRFSGIRLLVGAHTIELSTDFDTHTLCRLLSLLP